MTTLLPLVSVVSVYYNRADHVEESVKSLLDQDYQNLEIVLVDDGSTDDTYEKLSFFADDKVTVVTHENKGFVNSIKDALATVSGDYVAIHGSGDISMPSRIREQASVLISNEEIGVVGCHILAAKNFGSADHVVKMPSDLPFRNTLKKRNLFSHGEVMFRRSTYLQAGGYRSLFTYAQDRDLWLRMSLHCDYAIVPEVLYKRKILPSGVGSTLSKLKLQAYLSDFAVQCAQAVDNGLEDPVEKFGPLSLFYRRSSPALANRFASVGIRWMVLKDEAEGWSLLEAAKREAVTPHVLLYYALGAMRKSTFLWRRIVKPLLVRRLDAD